jgi:hypothetical protein
MPLSDERWAALARDFRRAAVRAAPEWTGSNTHDPGITVLEVLGYALAELGYRSGAGGATPQARALAADIAGRATALAAAGGGDGAGDDCGGGLQRVRYFAGKLLDADELQSEQNHSTG